jgi:hypothetical protein
MSLSEFGPRLKSRDPQEILEALREIGELSGITLDRDSLALLYDLTFHEDLPVKMTAKKVLARLEASTKTPPTEPPSLMNDHDHVSAGLRSLNPEEILNAVEQLAEDRSGTVYHQLYPLLGHPDAGVRARVALAIHRFPATDVAVFWQEQTPSPTLPPPFAPPPAPDSSPPPRADSSPPPQDPDRPSADDLDSALLDHEPMPTMAELLQPAPAKGDVLLAKMATLTEKPSEPPPLPPEPRPAPRDIAEYLPRLRDGNLATILSSLKEMFELEDIRVGKDLFEILYDLKFSRDFQVKFWAKKVLNKFEVKSVAGTQGNAAPEEQPPEAAPVQEIPEEVPLETLIRKMKNHFTDLSLDDLQRLMADKSEEILPIALGYLKQSQDIMQISFLTKTIGVNFPREDILPELAVFLRHEDTRVVANTVEGITACQSPRTFVLLSQLLHHPDNRVQSNVAVAISKYDKEEATQILRRMIDLHGKSHMQASACHAIKSLGDPNLLPLLRPLLESSEEFLFNTALAVFPAFTGSQPHRLLASLLPKVADTPEKVAKMQEIMDQVRKNTETTELMQSRAGKVKSWMV